MTRSQADVTVVIPTVGMSRFLRDAVESALADAPAEIVVVNDGAQEIAFRGARVVRIEHAGRSAARNRGVEEARTELVAFLDDDDLVLPGRFARQAGVLREAPLTFGRVEVVDGERRPLADWNELLEHRFPAGPVRAAELLARQTPIYTSATLVRRDAFLEAGGYDPALDAYEDLDLYLRLARLGPLVPTPGEPVVVYRLHGENTPSDRLYEGLLAVAEKHLSESRGAVRRSLLARRVDALWGLGRFGAARREAARATFAEPLLLGDARFLLRLAGSALPGRLLERRR
jgi:glycosyltransferase involved in cell wall biosynthesis